MYWAIQNFNVMRLHDATKAREKVRREYAAENGNLYDEKVKLFLLRLEMKMIW